MQEPKRKEKWVCGQIGGQKGGIMEPMVVGAKGGYGWSRHKSDKSPKERLLLRRSLRGADARCSRSMWT